MGGQRDMAGVGSESWTVDKFPSGAQLGLYGALVCGNRQKPTYPGDTKFVFWAVETLLLIKFDESG